MPLVPFQNIDVKSAKKIKQPHAVLIRNKTLRKEKKWKLAAS